MMDSNSGSEDKKSGSPKRDGSSSSESDASKGMYTCRQCFFLCISVIFVGI